MAHSDASTESGGAGRGMWVVTRYDDVLEVAQEWRTFSSDYRLLMEAETFSAEVGDTPPISTDPPLQRDFRRRRTRSSHLRPSPGMSPRSGGSSRS